MKVLFLTTCYKRSKDCFTMAPWLHILARNMVRRGIDVKVLAPTDYGSKNVEIIDGVEIHRFQYWFNKSGQRLAYGSGTLDNLRNSLLAFLQVPFYLFFFLVNALRLSRDTDVIHAHWAPSGLIGFFVKKLQGIPVYLTFRGSGLRYSPNWILRLIASGVDVVNVDTRIYIDKLDSLKIDYNLMKTKLKYIDKSRFNSRISSKSVIKEFGLEDNIVVTNVGRLVPDREIDIFIKSIPYILSSSNIQFKFLIVGDGPLYTQFIELSEKLGVRDSIIFTGNRPDINELYAASDIVCITECEWICYSNVILESMEVGTPCLLPKNQDTEENWTNGYDCLLYKERDSEDLASKVIQLINDKVQLKEMGFNCQEWCKNNGFYEEEVIGSTIDTYRSLANA